jgi:hypothetical protein
MRRYLLILSLGWILLLVAFVGVNWLVDPYRIFHEPWVRENYYPTDGGMRQAASGIINTEAFDSIVLGTSMAENFSGNEATEIFRHRFVNISLSGSKISERAVVLRYALNSRPIREVIFSLDYPGAFDTDSIRGTPIEPYAYLYDDSRANDLQVYASSLGPIRYAFCRNDLLPYELLCQNMKNDLENLVEWHSDWEHSKRFGGLNKWLEAKNNGQIKVALKSIADSVHTIESGKVKAADPALVDQNVMKYRKVFNESLLSIAAQYPKTRFYLFFPPYSRLNYAILQQSDPQRFEDYLVMLRSVIRDAEKYPNVKVFGFETEDFLDDIANYKDTSHYHQLINSKILYWMKNGEHELTSSNLETYIKEIAERAAGYPLKQIGAQIDAYLTTIHRSQRAQ